MTPVPGPLLQVTRLSKSYGRTTVLRDVDLEIQPGEVHALVGGNGSGKSTLIKALAGVIGADPGGMITVAGEATPAARWSATSARNAGLRFVHQDLGLFGGMTVAENLSLGNGYPQGRVRLIDWRRTRVDAQDLLDRFGVEVRARASIGELGPAQRSMVAIVRCLRGIPEGGAPAIVVLDEPTAALHVAEVDQLLNFVHDVTQRGHAALLVSHHIEEVRRAASRLTVLRDGRVVGRGAAADLTREALIEMIVGRAEVEAAGEPRPEASGRTVLDVSQLSTRRLAPMSVRVRAGECVGLTGVVGSGAEELLHALYGLRATTTRSVTLDDAPLSARSPRQAMRAGLAFVPADRRQQGVFAGLRVQENLTAASIARFARFGVLRKRSERATAVRLVHEFGVMPARADRSIQTLSGGNQQKVVLARWVDRQPRLLLLEEPTQGVDIGARHDIWNVIRAYADRHGAAVLAASSDLEELAAHCDRILVFGRGELSAELTGDALNAATVMDAVYRAEQTTATLSERSQPVIGEPVRAVS